MFKFLFHIGILLSISLMVGCSGGSHSSSPSYSHSPPTPEDSGPPRLKPIPEMSADEIRALTPEQFESMGNEQIVGQFSPDQIRNLRLDHLIPVTIESLRNPPVLSLLTPLEIRNLTPQHLAAVPAATFGTLDVEQVQALGGEQIRGLNGQQANAIPDHFFPQLTLEQIRAISARAHWGNMHLEARQAHALSPAQFQGLTIHELRELLASGSLTVEQFHLIPLDRFPQINLADFVAYYAHFTPEQIQSLTAEQFLNLEGADHDLFELRAHDNQIHEIPQNWIGFIPVEAFRRFRPNQVRHFLRHFELGLFTVDQLSALTVLQLAELTYDDIARCHPQVDRFSVEVRQILNDQFAVEPRHLRPFADLAFQMYNEFQNGLNLEHTLEDFRRDMPELTLKQRAFLMSIAAWSEDQVNNPTTIPLENFHGRTGEAELQFDPDALAPVQKWSVYFLFRPHDLGLFAHLHNLRIVEARVRALFHRMTDAWVVRRLRGD